MKEPTQHDRSLSKNEEEWEVVEALRRFGLVTPKTEEQMLNYIKRIEEHPPTLPSDLADQERVLERIFGPPVEIKHGNKVEDIYEGRVESLRRAARNGKEITLEIEEEMRKAREQNKKK